MSRISVLAAVAVLAAAVVIHLRSAPGEETLSAQLEPAIVPVITPTGGVVLEVLVKEGAKVHAGDVLVRLDHPGLRSRFETLQRAEAASGTLRQKLALLRNISPEARSMMLQMHPARQRVEAGYVAALQEYDRASGEQKAAAKARLDQAAAERTRVTRQLSDSFPSGAEQLADPASSQAPADLRAAVESLTVRAPVNGTVELLQLKPGDRLEAARPVLLLADENSLHADVNIVAGQPVTAVLPNDETVSCQTQSLQPTPSRLPFQTRPLTRVILPRRSDLRPGLLVALRLGNR